MGQGLVSSSRKLATQNVTDEPPKSSTVPMAETYAGYAEPKPSRLRNGPVLPIYDLTSGRALI